MTRGGISAGLQHSAPGLAHGARAGPATGSAAGGDTVYLSGGFFLEGATVFFGDQEAPTVTRFGPNADSTVLLQVTTPPGQGAVEVRAVNTIPGRSESIDSVTFTYENTDGYIRGDVDSGGNINLTDAVFLLVFLFQAGPPPPPPGIQNCGPDGPPTDGLAECAYESC